MASDTELRYFVFWAAMNYERVIQFYTSCLEMELVETVETENSVYVSLKDKNLDVNKPVLLKFKFAKDKLKGFPRSEKVQRAREQPHLVFYAKDVESITTRIACSNTGAWVFVEPREVVGGVKVAVAVDPSGYTIRLVGLAQDKLCRESVKLHKPSMQRGPGGRAAGGRSSRGISRGGQRSTKKKNKDGNGIARLRWNVRFGYVVLQCEHASDTANCFEWLFSRVVHADGESDGSIRSRPSSGMTHRSRMPGRSIDSESIDGTSYAESSLDGSSTYAPSIAPSMVGKGGERVIVVRARRSAATDVRACRCRVLGQCDVMRRGAMRCDAS